MWTTAHTQLHRRRTPSLWTKTNFILASLTSADLMIGAVGIPCYLAVYTVVNFIGHGDQCRYKVLLTVAQCLNRIWIWISTCNLIIVGIDRYTAILHPLVYEVRMTNTVIKVMIAGAWTCGALLSMTFLLWLVNIKQHSCQTIPFSFFFIDTAIYLITSLTLISVYCLILREALRQKRKIMAADVVAISATTVSSIELTVPPAPVHSGAEGAESNSQNNHVSVELGVPPGVKPTTSVNPMSTPVPAEGSTSAAPGNGHTVQYQQQHHHQQQLRYRRREYKAVYLTAGIIGCYTVLWFPYEVGRFMFALGYVPPDVMTLMDMGGDIGMFYCSANWAIYAAVSRSFRKAYRKILGRSVIAIAWN